MAFQVVFNITQIPLPPVVLITAGEDRNVACGNIVNLLGVVDKPENLPGHSILWEQLAGVSVILSNPTSLITSYSFIERSDKIFRLWVDKGKSYQQFMDISIFHTPKSDAATYLSNSTYIIKLPIPDVVECSSISGIMTVSVLPPLLGQPDRTQCQPDGGPPVSGANFSLSISWTVPNSISQIIPNFIETELFYADTNTPVLNAKYPDAPGSVVTHVFATGGELELKTYYVVSRYDVGGRMLTGKSCVIDFTTLPIPALHSIDDEMREISLSNSYTTLIKFTNSVFINVSDASINLSDSTVNIIKFGNITQSGSSNISSSLSNTAINISRFDPTGIGT